MSILKRFSLVLFFLWFSSLLVCHAGQSRPGGHTFRYRVTSRGFGVGEMKTAISPVQHADGPAVRFQSDLAIDANLLLFKVTFPWGRGAHGMLRLRLT